MDAIPPITTSILDGMRNGFGMLDTAATELVDGSGEDSPASNAGLPAASVSVGNPVGGHGDEVDDQMVGGVRDLMMARLQIGASAGILHVYAEDRRDLFEMLRPD